MTWKRGFRDNLSLPFEWRINGYEIVDSQNRFVAPVYDILWDEEADTARYVIGKIGGLMGIEGKVVLIPAPMVNKGGAGTLMVTASEEELREAPTPEDPEDPTRTEEELILRHFWQKPYWEDALEENPLEEEDKQTDDDTEKD